MFGGRYHLEDEIGRGGCAVVHRARDLSTGEEVALKVLQAADGAVARFEREVELMSTLIHPHLVKVFAFDTEDSPPWMAMELADGTVRDLVARGIVPPIQVVRLGLQTLAALAFAHRAGVVHRDVKPTNLLLVGGAVRLADFGIARTATSKHTAVGVALGSSSFMAPEQQVDARRARPTADVYGMGTTLYAVLTRKSPAALYLVPADGPRWERVPPALRPVLFRATRAHPRERWPTAEAMAEGLLEALVDSPEAGSLPAVWERARAR